MIKYAFARDMAGEHAKWTLTPWRLRGLEIFDRVSQIPDNFILIASHFAPWREPLRSWIADGRPWLEIEYGYWGPDTPRRETRRVTYRGHHNLHMRPAPYSRADLFPLPLQQPWRTTPGDYVVGIEPVEVILTERTGETMAEFHERIESAVRPYWSGPIIWRNKIGAKHPRFASFVDQLQQAHAVVGERTMACVESCLLGVPGYTVDFSMSTLLMGGIENINCRNFPERAAWWEHICWSQFNRLEFNTADMVDVIEQYQVLSH